MCPPQINKAPAGLIEGDVIHCNTNEQIEDAIETRYAAMDDYTAKLFVFNMHSNDLGLPGGGWHVTINRCSVKYGCVFAYSYGVGFNHIFARAKINGAWLEWHQFAAAVPPAWHNLQLTDAFVPDGDGAVNQYCKEQFGRVTVRLQCKTAVESGIASEATIAVLPAGFRPIGNQMRTWLFRDNAANQIGYIHFYVTGTLASGQLHNGGNLKKINCEFSYFAE